MKNFTQRRMASNTIDYTHAFQQQEICETPSYNDITEANSYNHCDFTAADVNKLEGFIDHIQSKFNIGDEEPDEDTILEVLNSEDLQSMLQDREIQLMIAKAIIGGNMF